MRGRRFGGLVVSRSIKDSRFSEAELLNQYPPGSPIILWLREASNLVLVDKSLSPEYGLRSYTAP